MAVTVDLEALFAPISADKPAGVDLRYTPVYDEIREARRAEDPMPQGEWEREVKRSDWSKVIDTSLQALTDSSKDLLIASWLAEALTVTQGFPGIDSGMALLKGLLDNFWEHAYPRIEGDDLDYRLAPFEFMNDKLSALVRQIPLTDPRVTPGYGYLKWQESRRVGYESDPRGAERAEKLSEGKLAAEEFDAAVANSPSSFYSSLAQAVSSSLDTFKSLESEVNQRFGKDAPSLSDLGDALLECHGMVTKICEQKGLQDALEAAASAGTGEHPLPAAGEKASTGLAAEPAWSNGELFPAGATEVAPAAAPFASPVPGRDGEPQESRIWNEAVRVMSERGFREALDLLLAAAGSQSSERGRNRYRFLVAKLCLKGGRPELARPIVEQLQAMIDELQLEKWESPFWISEIYQALHQCLLAGDDCDGDAARAKELFRRICIMDVTKALAASN